MVERLPLILSFSFPGEDSSVPGRGREEPTSACLPNLVKGGERREMTTRKNNRTRQRTGIEMISFWGAPFLLRIPNSRHNLEEDGLS